ncbi:MAG: hypothetical protein OEY49_17430, partial [Candidatus Heimdallarchaeota archaeon]|nr:hypothetical protein [Candidatus Heimdallarchaeota archaeon]
TADSTNLPYSMVTFFIVATGFFTVFSGVMETTVTAISEENQLGTMGFLVTNSVSPIAIIIGRYISATVRWGIIMITIVIPPLIIKGVYPSNLQMLGSTLIIFLIAWLFMLGFTLILTSIALIFKKTTTLNRVGIYIVRFASGAFIPITSFDNSVLIFGKPLSNYLIWFPPAFALEAFRWLFTINTINGLNCSDCGLSKDNLSYKGFNSIFGTNTTDLTFGDPMIQKMFLIILLFLVISLLLAEKLTTISRKWGTIEFY